MMINNPTQKTQRNHEFMYQIAKRDNGWKCHYCHKKLEHIRTKTHRIIYGYCYWDMVEDQQQSLLLPTLDHKKPRAWGGQDELRNLVLSCPACNTRKGSRYSYKEFKALIDEERKNKQIVQRTNNISR